MRRVIPWTLAAVLCAQSAAPVNPQRRAAYPRLYALTELARSAPPEFAAYGLLHLLDASAIPDPAWRLDLAQEALEFASSARHPIRKRLAPGFAPASNRATLWHNAYQLELDRLTLSLRAIEHIRQVNPNAAREAFANLPHPAPARTTCKDALLDDTSAWYAAAARLGVDPLPAVQSLQSHTEIAPALELILQAARSNEQLDLLAGALGQQLGTLPADARGFNAALFDSPKGIQQLYNALVARERPTAPLADGWHAWMRSGLEAPACQDARSPGPQQDARKDAFDLISQTLSPALDAELLKPTGTAEAANLEPFAETEATRTQAVLFKNLLFGEQSRGLSAAEKETPEWREQMQKFIQSIEGRTRSADESDIEYFYRQSQLWSAVLMAAPASPVRDRALHQYVAFLLANAPHIDPVIWFEQVTSMVETSRSLHGPEFAKVLQALRLSGHPVLRLYAELESAYPTRPHPKSN